MKLRRRTANPITKKAKRGFRGYPVATIAFYGPDDKRASKVAVGIISQAGADADPLQRWFSEEQDLRRDEETAYEIAAFVREHKVVTVTSVDRIIGCPHEEGIDYPDGEACPQCPFWRNRDRFTGELIN